MTSSKRLRMAAILLAAGAAGVSPRALLAQPAAPAPPDVAAVAKHDLDQLAGILADPQSRQEQRDEAARRLVSRQSADAQAILANALVDLNNPAGQLAAARALQDNAEPDPALINPLFAALGGNRQLTEAAAHALANYKTNPEVLNRLITIIERRPPAPETVRREIIRALGSIIEKHAAETLVNVLKNPDETASMQAAAADALADLTGISDYGQDPQQWTQWWTANADKSESDFRNDLLPPRSAKYDQIRQRYNGLTSELEGILKSQYQTAAAAQRPDIIMRYLKSAEPEVRAVGVVIIRDDALDNKPISNVTKDQLRSMIGDSSARVRATIADALAKINDAASLEPLLTQLAQETDGRVRASLAQALAPINDLRAVPALINLLDDPSIPAARAAAEALQQLGPKLREENPPLASKAARALQQQLEKRPANPSNAELREAIVNGMVPLRNEDLLPTFYKLINERSGESAEIRRLTLKAIGEISNPQAAAVIVNALGDRDQHVRLEAVRALGKVRTVAEYAETLRARLDPNEESDPSVRDEAWRVLQSVLSDLSPEKLVDFSDRFKNEPDRQILVLLKLEEKLASLNRQDDLADTRQNIGSTYMRLKDPKSAADYFKRALDYKKTLPQLEGVVLANLTEALEQSLLLSGQYDEAIKFAGQSIRENPNNQQSMGAAIRQRADQLRSDNSLDDAMKLIQETHKMNPPLAAQYRDQLSEIEADITKRLNQRGGNPNPTAEPINTASGQ